MPAVKLGRPQIKKDPISNVIRSAADDRMIKLRELAKMANIPYSTLCARLQHPETFRRGEILEIYKVLCISDEEKSRVPW